MKEKSIILCRKIQILINDSKEEVKTHLQNLKKLNNEIFVIKNSVINTLFFNDQAEERKELFNIKEDFKDIFNTSYQNSSYQYVVKKLNEDKHISSNIIAAVTSEVYKNYKAIRYDVKLGKRTIQNYRKDTPIPFMKTMIRNLSKRDGKYTFVWNNIPFIFHFGKDKSNNKSIVDKIMANEFQMCDSSFSIDGQDIYFNLTFKQKANTSYTLLEENVCGVDLGYNNPAVCAINDIAAKNQSHDNKLFCGSKEEFERVRNYFYKHRWELQKNSTMNQGGKGRNHKLKKLYKLKTAESNWVKTYNHKISKMIVEFALKNQCKYIALEDLTNIRMRALSSDKLFKKWAYYQLQVFVKNKAEFYGMITLFKNPRHSSQTCCECNNLDPEQRKGETFTCKNENCKNFNKPTNADYNAAKNLANGNYEIHIKNKEKACIE